MAKETNYYQEFCKDEFKKLNEKTDRLTIRVENGLTHRTKRIEKMVWFIGTCAMGLVISKIVEVLF